MADCIEREAAIAIIEEKQKELCPAGCYGRGYVYGIDREKYDAWDEIIDALENILSADVVPVAHGRWGTGRFNPESGNYEYEKQCSHCMEYSTEYGKPYCPNCGAKMDGGADRAVD